MFDVNSDGRYQRYAGVRPEMMEALLRYGKEHKECGDFLMAVFRNDLKEALARADSFNQANLHTIVLFMYNEMPSACWGSPEKVEAWLKAGLPPGGEPDGT